MNMGKELGQALRGARVAKGLKVKDVAEHVGLSASAVSQWEAGTTEPGFQNLVKASEFLGLDPFDLILTGGSDVATMVEATRTPDRAQRSVEPPSPDVEPMPRLMPASSVRPAPDAPSFEALQGLARDVPVYGIAVAGEDADFRLNGNEVDRAVRPPGLKNVKGLFALYVSNDSMYPAWREGALFYVNPNRPPKVGDDVVVEYHPLDGEPGAAFLKRLKSRSRGKYVVEQFNPPQELEFEQSQVRLYRVVPWEEALGLS
jgi:phage repressor protein C with HTH and peptisase S24 domain